jgi:hypothetical protein
LKATLKTKENDKIGEEKDLIFVPMNPILKETVDL